MFSFCIFLYFIELNMNCDKEYNLDNPDEPEQDKEYCECCGEELEDCYRWRSDDE